MTVFVNPKAVFVTIVKAGFSVISMYDKTQRNCLYFVLYSEYYCTFNLVDTSSLFVWYGF